MTTYGLTSSNETLYGKITRLNLELQEEAMKLEKANKDTEEIIELNKLKLEEFKARMKAYNVIRGKVQEIISWYNSYEIKLPDSGTIIGSDSITTSKPVPGVMTNAFNTTELLNASTTVRSNEEVRVNGNQT